MPRSPSSNTANNPTGPAPMITHSVWMAGTARILADDRLTPHAARARISTRAPGARFPRTTFARRRIRARDRRCDRGLDLPQERRADADRGRRRAARIAVRRLPGG